MRWFIPSWNGDLRLEPMSTDKTRIVVFQPTSRELDVLHGILARGHDAGWLSKSFNVARALQLAATEKADVEIVIDAPLEEVGPVAVELMLPGPAVLTAVRFADGHVETTSGSSEGLRALAKRGVEADAGAEAPAEAPADDRGAPEDAKAKPKDKEPKDKTTAAASVKRPTPCCPSCMPGSVEPARQVLLSFLTPEQHETWAKDRYLVAYGEQSGHPYVIAHRHTPLAQRIGRICYDMHDRGVVHFHDWSVPPEEEVLAAKLILEHREPWLRNEATCLGLTHDGQDMGEAIPFGSGGSMLYMGARGWTDVYKNPFGDVLDGTESTAMMRDVGRMLGG